MQSEIEKLPREEFWRLADWIAERRAVEWDEQIEADAQNGKLQSLYDKLAGENEGEDAAPLDDFLDKQKFS